ncbi:MAG: YciI family protein [Thermomicrobiales bacterium]|nr:YciI family protein [Thermomicrobiales bacterium]
MKYLCLVYHDAEARVSERPAAEIEQIQHSVRDFIGELRLAGRHVFSSPLQPPETAATMRLDGGMITVSDGPFIETKEHLAGFYIFDARDLNDAIRLAARTPSAQFGSIEVRPLDEAMTMDH